MGWAKFNEDIQSRIEDRWVLRENIGAVITTKTGKKRNRGEAEKMNARKAFVHDEFYKAVMNG